MKRRSVKPVFDKQYKKLHKAEKRLCRRLAALHAAYAADIKDIITAAYEAATDGDKQTYAALR